MKPEDRKTLFLKWKFVCLYEQKAYEYWLNFLTPVRWTAITLGVILPAVAGVSYFKKESFPDWEAAASIILLFSGIVSALHTGLKCDAHQADCRRISNKYKVLANKFDAASRLEKEDEIKEMYDKLEPQFMTLQAETETTPSAWSYQKAAKIYPQGTSSEV